MKRSTGRMIIFAAIVLTAIASFAIVHVVGKNDGLGDYQMSLYSAIAVIYAPLFVQVVAYYAGDMGGQPAIVPVRQDAATAVLTITILWLLLPPVLLSQMWSSTMTAKDVLGVLDSCKTFGTSLSVGFVAFYQAAGHA
jgi:hypothetical protein